MESILVKLIFAATLVDVLVEFVKVVFDGYFKTKNIKYKNIVLRSISIIVGIALSIVYQLDFPAMWGLNSRITVVGEIITGLLISRGSNFIHDIVKKLGINTKL
ncbi:hypothetical protein [Clostridium ganghwense]|uniref:Holin n=1 Tax=Clostridium ganghwense TaxID=312089 RepID=A0ABT4CS27_9CLOT|nr:hypothetical protein [Clostridium ganghwense]MCY6371844.1 hypothetical protein [Clostridium ganghwense]